MKNKLTIILAFFVTLFYLNGCGHLEGAKPKEYPEFINNHKVGDKKMPVELSYDYGSLGNIVPMFAQVLKFNYIIKPSKHYKLITLYINAEYSEEEVWLFFVKVLKHCNASYTVEGTLVTISPNKKEPDAHVVQLTKTENDKVITITESGPPKKKKRITREEFNAMREKILKSKKKRRQENSNN